MISGGGRGLGAAITERLLADGWRVSLGLRDTAQAERFGGGENVFAAPFDATREADAEAWVAATKAQFGRIDALVNNAGILRTVGFSQGTEADLDDLFAVNVKAPFRVIRAALPHLKTAGAGRVVNIASTDGKRVRAGAPLGYAMVKHAVVAMTHAVRFEGWEDGVRATALCPGAIDTDLIADLPGATPKAERLTPETVAEIVAFILRLPNQATVAELVVNTRLESGM